MRLETPVPGDTHLVLLMSPREWKEVRALAEFAQAGLEYDCRANYVVQVFTYLYLVSRFGLSQPKDMRSNPNLQAAVAGFDRLVETVLDADGSSDIVLRLPKEQMRHFVMLLGKAAEAETQAQNLNELIPDEFPFSFPELEFPGSYYADQLSDLLAAIDAQRSLEVAWCS